MKLIRESIASGIVLFGLVGLMGCKSESKSDGKEAATPTATAAATATATAEADAPAAPEDKKEEQGKAPSPDHVWVAGHWSWVNHKYEWIPGYWAGAATKEPPPAKVETEGHRPSAK